MTLRLGERRLVILGDLLGLGLVAALLSAVHVFLPPPLQEQFAFQQSLGRPETLLTAAYLHVDDQHLLDNLVGYAAAAMYTYVLYLTAGERRWFRLAIISMLVAVPVLVNLTSMTLWTLAYAGDLPASRGSRASSPRSAGFSRWRYSSHSGRSTAG